MKLFIKKCNNILITLKQNKCQDNECRDNECQDNECWE
jgi:hypothetical protein